MSFELLTKSESLASEKSIQCDNVIAEIWTCSRSIVAEHPVEAVALTAGIGLACLRPARILNRALRPFLSTAAESAENGLVRNAMTLGAAENGLVATTIDKGVVGTATAASLAENGIASRATGLCLDNEMVRRTAKAMGSADNGLVRTATTLADNGIVGSATTGMRLENGILHRTNTAVDSATDRLVRGTSLPGEFGNMMTASTSREGTFVDGVLTVSGSGEKRLLSSSAHRPKIELTYPLSNAGTTIPMSPMEALTNEFARPGKLACELTAAELRALQGQAQRSTALLFHDIFGRFTIQGYEKEITLCGTAWYAGSGRFVTNSHTVGHIVNFKLWTNSGKIVNARLESMLKDADLAVLKLTNPTDGRRFTAIPFGSTRHLLEKEIRVDAVHLGFPDKGQISGSAKPVLFREGGVLTGRATLNKHSNVDGGTPIGLRDFFEPERVSFIDGVTTARLSSGFSGGPVIDRSGRLLGVTWGSNQPRQIPTIGEALSAAHQGRQWTPPPLLPVERQRTFFTPVEYVKELLGKRQAPQTKTFFKLG